MSDPKQLQRRNARTAIVSLTVVALMVGFAFASAPLFRMVCKTLGIGGATQVAAAAPDEVSDVPVTVRLDANTAPDLPWEFKPSIKSVTIKFGESTRVTYRAKNLTDRPITGTATVNVTPEKAGIYFNKIGCFCFQETTLQPGQEIELPVTFFVSPDLLKDEYANEVRIVTLSYTFFPSLNGEPITNQQRKDSAAVATPAAATVK